MKISEQMKSDLPVLIFCALIVFIRLGAGEVQPGEEGSVGIKAAVAFEYLDDKSDSGEYIDDEMHSSSFLNIITTASLFSIFGESAFVLRLFSALCSVGSVLLLYFISKRLISKELAVISSVLLSASLVWNAASRLAGSETAIVFFTLAALMAVVKAYETEKKTHALFCAFCFLLSTFLVFLILPVFSIIIVILFEMFSFKKEYNFAAKVLRSITYLLSMVVIVGSGFVSSAYDVDFISFFFGINESVSGSYSFDMLNLNYYTNILILSNPFFVFSFVFIVTMLVFAKKVTFVIREQKPKRLLALMMTWFFIVILFMFFAAFETPTYAVYCIIPMIIMAVWFYDKLPRFDFSARFKWIITAMFLSLLVFTFMNGIKPGSNYSIITDTPTSVKLLYGLVFLLLIALVFLPKEIVGKMTGRTLMNAWKYLPYLLLFKVVGINFMVPQGGSFGAAETALMLKEFKNHNIVYLSHDEEEGFRNTQLAWYLRKSIEDWKRKDIIKVPLGNDRIDFKTLAVAEKFPEIFAVYHIREKNDLTDRVVEELKKTRPLLLTTPNYLVFGMKRKEKPIDILAME